MGGILRIGVLGAARITPAAILKPARVVEGVEVTAVAARDPLRAEQFARFHDIPRVLDSYAALVEDPELDAIYNPLPNSLHAEWTIRALRAGKHVLCEKPLASNAPEAQTMVEAADTSGRVLMEAFHYRYHPYAQKIEEIVASGVLGQVRELAADFFIPLFLRPRDIRFDPALAGGGLMDTGCYCVNFLRWLGGGEPRVTWAQARRFPRQVDRVLFARLEFPNGVTARLGCSLAGLPPLKVYARVRGDLGELGISTPFMPHLFNRLTLKTRAGTRHERVTREPTYNFQLRAFLAATRGEPTNLTDSADGVKNMQVIDEIYRKAGMTPRGMDA